MKRRLIVIVMMFLLAVSASVAYLVSTERGLRWLFQRATQMAPGLSAERVHGRLIGPLEIGGLKYTAETYSATFKRLKLNWHPRKLFFFNVHLSELIIDGLHIETIRQEQIPPAPSGPAPLRLPVDLVIDHGSVTDMTFAPFDRPSPIEIQEVFLRGRYDGEALEVETFRVRAPAIEVDLHGTVRPEGDYPMDVETKWTVEVPDYFPVKGSGSFNGSLSDLHLVQNIHEPFRARLSADVAGLLADIRWNGILDVQWVGVHSLNPRWPEMTMDGRFETEGTPFQFDVRGSFEGREDKYVGKIAGEISLKQRGGDWTLTKLILTVPSRPSRVGISGSWSGPPDQKSFRIEGRWEGLVWPILKEAAFKSPVGRLNMEGSLDRYAFQVDGDLAYQEFPGSHWKIDGTGDLGHLVLNRISGALLDGGIDGTGKIRWEPDVLWEAELKGRDINPEGVLPRWPGRVDFSASATGAPSAQEKSLTVALHSLGGDLRNCLLSGQAFLNMKGDRWILSDLRLSLGRARLAGSGTLSETWNVVWNVQAETLADILEGGEGVLTGGGSLTGPRKTPKIIARINGRDLDFASYSTKELHLNAAADLQPTGNTRIDFEAKALNAGFRTFENVSLKAEGKTTSHQIAIGAVSSEESVAVSMKGAYLNETWTGKMTQARVDSEDFGTWRLPESDPLTVSLEKADVPDLCWESGDSRVCMAITWNARENSIGSIWVSGFPLSLLEPALPRALTLNGTIKGHATATFHGRTLHQGAIHWEGREGQVSYALEDDLPLTFGFHRILLDGSVKDTDLALTARVSLTDGGSVDGEVTLPSAVPLEKPFNPELRGNIRVALKRLGFLPVIFPEVQETKGRFRADLVLGGALSAPSVRGKVFIEEGEAFIPKLGVRWREVSVSGTGEAFNTFKLNGRIRSGEGEMTFEGDIRIPVSGERSAHLRIQGKSFELARLPEVRILASPDLDLRLRGDEIHIRGELNIPEAAIEPRDLSGSVQASSDVKVVGKREKEKNLAQTHIFSQVRFILGEKVQFKGFGLNARLSGSLKVEEAPDTITTGTGEIQILDGEYKAYGQMLEIENGRLVFADSPIDNPGLDIRAVRKSGEVTAGVNIGGRLQDPRLNLFSIPPMDQADVLSYLLLGRPLRQASRSEGQALYNAATSAGIAGGAFLAKKIGNLFGLEQVEVEKGETREDTTLFIGKYLSPRIFLAYGLGLFEPVNTLRVRYEMSKNWLFETEHGVETGADLLFKFER